MPAPGRDSELPQPTPLEGAAVAVPAHAAQAAAVDNRPKLQQGFLSVTAALLVAPVLAGWKKADLSNEIRFFRLAIASYRTVGFLTPQSSVISLSTTNQT